MHPEQAVLFFILCLAAEIAGTIGGFGSSVFVVPLAGLFFDFTSVLMVTALLHNFSNSSKIILFRKHINYNLLLLYGIPSVVFVIAGSVLIRYINFKYAELLLGIFLLTLGFFFLVRPSFQLPVTKTNSVGSGAAAGFLAGFIGTGGAVRGMSLAAFNLEKSCFIATSAAIDFFVDISRTVVYIRNGYFEKTHIWILPLLFAAAWFGSSIGKKIVKHISQQQFKKTVLLFLMAMGCVMIFKSLTANS